jgi:glucose-6-phosphate dehydrogenase assembly protein OpcA
MEIKQNTPSDDIQEKLNRLRTPGFGEENKACLFNLIVYAHETRRTQYFKEVVKTIMSQFPCRIFFIEGNPSSKEDYFRVQISTEKSQDEKGIICDQVFIEAAGQDINRVYFLLLPLFVPDLPIYLLWGQDPATEYSILPHLQHFATRLIFDSETSEELQLFSYDMLNRIGSSNQIVDMNWARIGGWREVIAETFDSRERFDLLTTANNIQVTYNDRPSDLFLHPKTQAIYLQAWLVTRLGWHFQNAEKKDLSQIINYQSSQGIHQIQLDPKTNENFESGEILGLTVEGSNYICHLKRLDNDQVEVQASNQFECDLPFTLYMPTLRSGRSFMQEIFYQKTSDQYLPTLQLISLVKWS